MTQKDYNLEQITKAINALTGLRGVGYLSEKDEEKIFEILKTLFEIQMNINRNHHHGNL